MAIKASLTSVTFIGIGMTCLLAASFAFAGAPAACDPQTVAKADPGYMCVVKTGNGPVSWRVEAVAQGSRPFRVMKDLKSGIYVSDDLGKHSHETSMKKKLCNSPDYANQRGNLASVAWRLPSGYPRSQNGKNGFPNRDSDFVVLEDDGIREVIAGLASKYFISSSELDGGAAYSSYGYDGEFGGVDPGCDGNGNVSLRCVGQQLRKRTTAALIARTGKPGDRLTTDCHDGSNTVFVDCSGAGPTTWGGCHLIGVSTGVNDKF